jgi:hypothetical protein
VLNALNSSGSVYREQEGMASGAMKKYGGGWWWYRRKSWTTELGSKGKVKKSPREKSLGTFINSCSTFDNRDERHRKLTRLLKFYLYPQVVSNLNSFRFVRTGSALHSCLAPSPENSRTNFHWGSEVVRSG